MEQACEFLVVFAYHPMYFNMRFQELEALASMHGIHSRSELYVGEPPTAMSDSPLVRVRLLGGEAVARAITERAVLVKAVLEVWGVGATFKEAVAAGMACSPALLEKRRELMAPPKTMQIKVVSFGKTASMEEKRDIIDTLKPFLRGNELIDLHNSDVVVWALEEFHHHTGQKGQKDFTGPPLQTVVGRQVAGGRSVDKKNSGEKAYFQQYDLSNRAVLGPTTMENQLAFIMANCACVDVGKVAMDPFCGTGGLLVAMSHFGARVVGGEIDIRVIKGWRVAYLKNKEAAREVAAIRKAARGADEADTTVSVNRNASTEPDQDVVSAVALSRRGAGLDPNGAMTMEHLASIGMAAHGWSSSDFVTQSAATSSCTSPSRYHGRSSRKKADDEDLQTDIFTNFIQYKLQSPEIVICDAAMRPWRKTGGGWLDSIVTDPPYGVRAASKKQGRDSGDGARGIEDRSTYIPSKVSYGEEELNYDLLELAAKSLTDGGRMTYLAPVDLADFLGIDRSAESNGGSAPSSDRQWAAARLSGAGAGGAKGANAAPVKLHDVAMPKGGRTNKDPRLCISETTRDPLLLDEARYLDFLPSHKDLEIVGASMQILSGGLGRLLVTVRRKHRC